MAHDPDKKPGGDIDPESLQQQNQQQYLERCRNIDKFFIDPMYPMKEMSVTDDKQNERFTDMVQQLIQERRALRDASLKVTLDDIMKVKGGFKADETVVFISPGRNAKRYYDMPLEQVRLKQRFADVYMPKPVITDFTAGQLQMADPDFPNNSTSTGEHVKKIAYDPETSMSFTMSFRESGKTPEQKSVLNSWAGTVFQSTNSTQPTSLSVDYLILSRTQQKKAKREKKVKKKLGQNYLDLRKS